MAAEAKYLNLDTKTFVPNANVLTGQMRNADYYIVTVPILLYNLEVTIASKSEFDTQRAVGVARHLYKQAGKKANPNKHNPYRNYTPQHVA